jgi:type IV secretion system protein VirD4
MRGSVLPAVGAKLQFLSDPRVIKFSSSSLLSPDFFSLRKIPTALYWCLPERDIQRLRPLTSLFFTLLISELSTGKEKESIPVTLLLDEFANVGKIPNFESIISVARGRDISLFLGLQALSQLETIYGKPNSQTILTNCSTKVILHGLDAECSERISKSLGDTTYEGVRRARSWIFGILPNIRETITTGGNQRRLLTSDEVRQIGEDRAIVISGNKKPLYVKRVVFDDYNSGESILEPLGEGKALLLTLKNKIALRAKKRKFSKVGDFPEAPEPLDFQ